DLAKGVARVELPDAIERKYPRAAQELGWQFVFASRQFSSCPRSGRIGRHHLYPASVQRAVAQAGRAARLPHAIHCHTFRHSCGSRRVRRGSPTPPSHPCLAPEAPEPPTISPPPPRLGVASAPSPLDALGDLSPADLDAALDAPRRLAGEAQA